MLGWLRLPRGHAACHGRLGNARAATVPLSPQYKMALRRKNKHFRSIRPTPTVRSKVTVGVLCHLRRGTARDRGAHRGDWWGTPMGRAIGDDAEGCGECLARI